MSHSFTNKERQTMRAIHVSRFGPPNVLKMVEVPVPIPQPGEVLVRTKAAGVNFADVFARLGVYPQVPKPPFTPGIEYSGIVEQVGPGVRGMRRGERVFGFTRQGAYAEYVLVPREYVKKKPAKMSFQEAAIFTVMYLTASHGIEQLAHARPGETLLVHAGAGGVGIACIQIAKLLGLRVIATVGSDAKADVARQQGADEVINYTVEDFARAVRKITQSRGVDIIMDGVGGSVYRKGLNLLAPMGRYVLFGVSEVNSKRLLNVGKIALEYMMTPRLFPPSMIQRNVGFFGFNLYLLNSKVSYISAALDRLIGLYTKGKIKPLVGSTFPLHEVVAAHEILQDRKVVGRNVLLT